MGTAATADAPTEGIDFATIHDALRDGVAIEHVEDCNANGSNSAHPLRASREEAERRFRARRATANRAHYGDKVPANLRPATAEEAAAIIAAWREGGLAKDSEALVSHNAGRLRDYLAKLEFESLRAAAEKRADLESRAREKFANYQSQREGLIAKIDSASEAEAFLDTLGKALAGHAAAEKARQQLAALIDRATEAAAAIGEQPPPMSGAPAAPLAAVRVMHVFHAFNANGIGDGD